MNKWGIFGGTFNPFHNAHIKAVVFSKEKLGLEKVLVMPARQNPIKTELELVSAEHRTKMAEIATQDYVPDVLVDSREVLRTGPSYTIESVRELTSENPDIEFYLMLGMDAFEQLDRWKDFAKLLELCHVAVISRPGFRRPFSKADFPRGVEEFVSAYDGECAVLKTGKTIEFLKMGDLDVSSSQIRKKLKTGQNVDKYLDSRVEEYIKSEGLYAPVGPRIGDYQSFTEFCSSFLAEKSAIDVRAFKLPEHSTLSDFSVVASGTSTRQTTSLAENLVHAVKEEYGVAPISVEGASEGRWVVLDYGALIIHIFYDYLRQQYNLEELWREGEALPLAPTTQR